MHKRFGTPRDSHVVIRLRPAERVLVEELATHEGRSMSDLLRDVLPLLQRRAKAIRAAGATSGSGAPASSPP